MIAIPLSSTQMRMPSSKVISAASTRSLPPPSHLNVGQNPLLFMHTEDQKGVTHCDTESTCKYSERPLPFREPQHREQTSGNQSRSGIGDYDACSRSSRSYGRSSCIIDLTKNLQHQRENKGGAGCVLAPLVRTKVSLGLLHRVMGSDGQ